MLRWQTFVTRDEPDVVQEVDTSALPIGSALKVERTLAGVTTTDVAAAVQVSIGHLSRIESGERTASPELVESIREAIRSLAAKKKAAQA